MDSYDKTYLDIDELAKRIEERIKELETQDHHENFSNEELLEDYNNQKTKESISDLDRIIKEIDERIAEFEKEEKKKKEPEELNIGDLTDKINKKLEEIEDIHEEDLGKTIYDLSEISNAINETIKKIEEKKKRKKEMKAKYCDLARKNANKFNKKNYKE